jgi:hypothetical protein
MKQAFLLSLLFIINCISLVVGQWSKNPEGTEVAWWYIQTSKQHHNTYYYIDSTLVQPRYLTMFTCDILSFTRLSVTMNRYAYPITIYHDGISLTLVYYLLVPSYKWYTYGDSAGDHSAKAIPNQFVTGVPDKTAPSDDIINHLASILLRDVPVDDEERKIKKQDEDEDEDREGDKKSESEGIPKSSSFTRCNNMAKKQSIMDPVIVPQFLY